MLLVHIETIYLLMKIKLLIIIFFVSGCAFPDVPYPDVKYNVYKEIDKEFQISQYNILLCSNETSDLYITGLKNGLGVFSHYATRDKFNNLKLLFKLNNFFSYAKLELNLYFLSEQRSFYIDFESFLNSRDIKFSHDFDVDDVDICLEGTSIPHNYYIKTSTNVYM